MRVERSKQFLSLEECSALNDWVEKAVEKNWMVCGLMGAGRHRRTNRRSGLWHEYPRVVLDISDRVRNFCGVSAFPLLDNFGPDAAGKNGIIVSATFAGGNLPEHKDQKTLDGSSVLRCNIMTKSPKSGGMLYIDGKVTDVEVGELHCYLVSDVPHCVTTVEGETPRIMWMFGAAVPAQAWNNYDIKFGDSHERQQRN
jgi:hypothetical protein